MPGFDGTGPAGGGPLSGGGRGRCSIRPDAAQQEQGSFFGLGRRMGGRGQGRRGLFGAIRARGSASRMRRSNEDDPEALRQQARLLQEKADEFDRRSRPASEE